MSDKIKVGIVGCGFVFGALKTLQRENGNDFELFVSDPAMGFINALSEINIAFAQIMCRHKT